MFTFLEMLALVESESSFGAYVCHRRPGGTIAISDRVSINALLSKLSLIGFNYSALEWFANFLQRREQCVQRNGASSKWQIPKSGIP